jgi:hypothetical protein
LLNFALGACEWFDRPKLSIRLPAVSYIWNTAGNRVCIDGIAVALKSRGALEKSVTRIAFIWS